MEKLGLECDVPLVTKCEHDLAESLMMCGRLRTKAARTLRITAKRTHPSLGMFRLNAPRTGRDRRKCSLAVKYVDSAAKTLIESTTHSQNKHSTPVKHHASL